MLPKPKLTCGLSVFDYTSIDIGGSTEGPLLTQRSDIVLNGQMKLPKKPCYFQNRVSRGLPVTVSSRK